MKIITIIKVIKVIKGLRVKSLDKRRPNEGEIIGVNPMDSEILWKSGSFRIISNKRLLDKTKYELTSKLKRKNNKRKEIKKQAKATEINAGKVKITNNTSNKEKFKKGTVVVPKDKRRRGNKGRISGVLGHIAVVVWDNGQEREI